jgi:Tol biopolymer transport system component
MQVFRAVPRNGGRQKLTVFTFNVDGDDIKLAVDHRLWSKGGHHPNWHPDGEHLIMNLRPYGKKLLFCQYRYDGSDFRVLSEKHPGGGHPSITADGQYLVTDAYVNEGVVLPNKEVPIRLLDTRSDEVEVICYMYTLGREGDLGRGTLRLDPHPAWSRDYKRVCFNGAPEGRRQVFVADLSDKI